jgi:membrane fusion protein (multidrug efflux system)
VHEALTTVSTDDAYVNSHVTFVAPRVVGQVVKVLVDDNNRVRSGDLLVQLDDKPYRVIVDFKQAALAVARADLLAAETKVRGYAGQIRSARWKLQHTIEDVHNQVAALRAKVAAVTTRKVALELAEADFHRGEKLLTSSALSREDFETRQEAFQAVQAQLQQALEEVYQARVALGLPAKPDGGGALDKVPPDLDQITSSVREALFALFLGLATMALGAYWMSRMNLAISPIYIILPRVVLIVGLSFIFAPLNVAAYRYMPLALRGAAVGVVLASAQ